MNWRNAKIALNNGFRIKRPVWDGMLERHSSDDKTIYCVRRDGSSTEDKYKGLTKISHFKDFEIVEEPVPETEEFKDDIPF